MQHNEKNSLINEINEKKKRLVERVFEFKKNKRASRIEKNVYQFYINLSQTLIRSKFVTNSNFLRNESRRFIRTKYNTQNESS